MPFPPLAYALLFPGQATWLCAGLRVSSPTALCSTPLCGLNRTHTVTHTPFNAPESGEQTYAAQHTVSCCGVVMLTKYQPKFSAACITLILRSLQRAKTWCDPSALCSSWDGHRTCCLQDPILLVHPTFRTGYKSASLKHTHGLTAFSTYG